VKTEGMREGEETTKVGKMNWGLEKRY